MTNNAIIPESDGLSLSLVVDNYDDLSLSEEAQQRLVSIVQSARTGLVSAAPLICKGSESCPFHSRCPIFLDSTGESEYPLGKQCIVEVNLVQNLFSAYVEELSDYAPVIESITFRTQISKLVEFDLYEFRLKQILAGVGGESDGSLLIHQTIAIDKDTSEEIEQLQEHPAWSMQQRVQKQRMELLDAMGLTVKQRARIDVMLKRTSQDNYLSKTIEVLERISFLQEAMVKED